MPQTKPPAIPKAVVEWLEGLYPNRCARPGMSPEDIWRESGMRSVVDKVRSTYETQTQSPHQDILGGS